MRYFTEPHPDLDNPVYPCGVCNKKVGKRMRATRCDLCNFKTHIKCDAVEPSHYQTLSKPGISHHHFCKICKEEMFPFQKVENDNFKASLSKRNLPKMTIKI